MANKQRPTMRIPAPKLVPEQRCMVLNYRKRPGIYEPGTVQHAEFHAYSREMAQRNRALGYWYYSVIIDRLSPTHGTYMHLHVSDTGIRRK